MVGSRKRLSRSTKHDFTDIRVFQTKGKSGQSRLSMFRELQTVQCRGSRESERAVVCGDWQEVRVRKGAGDPVVTPRSLKDFDF